MSTIVRCNEWYSRIFTRGRFVCYIREASAVIIVIEESDLIDVGGVTKAVLRYVYIVEYRPFALRMIRRDR